jgi:hypothetical protein
MELFLEDLTEGDRLRDIFSEGMGWIQLASAKDQ